MQAQGYGAEWKGGDSGGIACSAHKIRSSHANGRFTCKTSKHEHQFQPRHDDKVLPPIRRSRAAGKSRYTIRANMGRKLVCSVRHGTAPVSCPFSLVGISWWRSGVGSPHRALTVYSTEGPLMVISGEASGHEPVLHPLVQPHHLPGTKRWV